MPGTVSARLDRSPSALSGPPGNDALGHGVDLIVGHVERPRGGRAGATSRSESLATATRVLAAYDLLTTD